MTPPRLALLVLAATGTLAASSVPSDRILDRAVLRDKIRGAWAGQMIGVAYGAKTEFNALGRMFTEEIKPEPLTNAIVQDDLYVEMTFAKVLDTIGPDATTADFGEAFRTSKYQLWHANAAARRNLNRGLAAPLSGLPQYNAHADDIDFQIEADFIGIQSPGLPQASNRLCDRVGRVMNHGDGLYGGMFVCGMYAAAYFEGDPRRVVEAGLACIPEGSSYAAVIRDVLRWSAEEPGDWTATWRRLTAKWDRDDVCPDGVQSPFNIDAKLNGAFIAMGMLYGRGDWARTMEVATRCGQDSDCNPSSAMGVLGAMIGYDRIPAEQRAALAPLADTKFDFTDYSFNTIVASTERRVLQAVKAAGGKVGEREVVIPFQAPVAPPLEQCNFGVPVAKVGVEDPAWSWEGKWTSGPGGMTAGGPGSAATLQFNGTGLVLVGPMEANGGRADVEIDGVPQPLVADAWIVPNTHDNDLWRVYGLKPGAHELRLVVRGDADPRSTGRQFVLVHAVAYR